MRALSILLTLCLSGLPAVAAEPAAEAAAQPAPTSYVDEFGLTWHFDYNAAYTQARQEKKLLLVSFDDAARQFVPDRQTAAAMKDLVLARLQIDSAASLLMHEGFRQLHNAPGVGIIDLKHEDQKYGYLVDVMPAAYWSMSGARAMIALADGRGDVPQLKWHKDYHAARAQAVAEEKMLLVAVDSADEAFAPRSESLPVLSAYVLLRQTTETKYDDGGQPRRLLDYTDFQTLRGKPGLVIYDFKHKDQPFYGEVVSAMPYRYLGPNPGNRVFGAEHRERELLSLEPNTLTRRTLTWAIRVSKGHGEQQRLRSADGRPHPALMQGALGNSLMQCRMGVGHFLGGIRHSEIASPGPGQDIVDGALNMVQIWASSPPHYGEMVSYHSEFGYDMAPSNDYHWYGTGRF